MSSLNKVQLIGRTGKDPDVRHLDSGITVCNFSLATSENYTNKQGEKVEQTEWHNIVVWGKLAEVVEKYVKKGMLVYIEGKLKTRQWEKENQKHYTTEIFADGMQMLSRPEQQGQQQAPAQATAQATPDNDWTKPEENDLPF